MMVLADELRQHIVLIFARSSAPAFQTKSIKCCELYPSLPGLARLQKQRPPAAQPHCQWLAAGAIHIATWLLQEPTCPRQCLPWVKHVRDSGCIGPRVEKISSLVVVVKPSRGYCRGCGGAVFALKGPIYQEGPYILLLWN